MRNLGNRPRQPEPMQGDRFIPGMRHVNDWKLRWNLMLMGIPETPQGKIKLKEKRWP